MISCLAPNCYTLVNALLILKFVQIVSTISDTNLENSKPEFIGKIPNLSITSGKDAVLTCSVRNLGDNVISWHHLESNSDLTVNKQVLTANPRIFIKQDKDNWLLLINNVSVVDRGFYVCRINWQEPNSQIAYLNVVDPPKFDETSFQNGEEIIVHEYDNLTTICKASGDPQPEIEWRREDGRPIINFNTGIKSNSESRPRKRIFGPQLNFQPVTRSSMGSYLCIASNGVPPSISRRVIITVHFPPVLRISSQLIKIRKGENATLQCLLESNPVADQQWIHSKGHEIKAKTNKYFLDSVETNQFKVAHKLIILNVDHRDGGNYDCLGNNSLGQTKSSISLKVEKGTRHHQGSRMKTSTLKPSTESVQLIHPKTTTQVPKHQYYNYKEFATKSFGLSSISTNAYSALNCLLITIIQQAFT